MNKLPATIAPKRNLPAHREDDRISQIVSAFESETTDVLARTSPRSERTIMYVLFLMLAIAIALCSVVKLDRIVTGQGLVIASSGPLYVSPLNAGLIKEIKVKVGDIVKKGQTLAELDPTMTGADVIQLQQKLAADSAAMNRLEAEHEGRPYKSVKSDPYGEVQQAIWQQRQAEYRSSLANFDGQIGTAQAQIAQYRRDGEQYNERARLASDVEGMYGPLAKKGYVSKLQLNSAKDTKEEMRRLHSESQNLVASRQQQEISVRAQKSAYMEKWRADAGMQLVEIRNQVNATRENLEKAQKLLELSTLVSPSDAIVLKIGKASTGSVATSFGDPGAPDALFTLVPLDTKFEAEIKVSSEDIGFIRTGDPVTVKLDAYPFIRHGTASGKVKNISEGSFTKDENNQPVYPYFKARIAIEELNLRNVPDDFRLIPGMTMNGDIVLGSRTIMSYLLSGVVRTGSEAMREAR